MTITYAQEITLPPAAATRPGQQEDKDTGTFPKVVLVRNITNEIDAILFVPQETVLEQAPAPQQPPVQPFAQPEATAEVPVNRTTSFMPSFNLGFKRPMTFWR